MSFGNSRSKAEQGIQQAGETMYQRGAMTPQETQQYQGSFGTGNLLNQAYLYRAGLGDAPSGYREIPEDELFGKGPLASAYYQQALRGVQDPYAAWQDSFRPQLQLMQDYVNASSQKRGLLNSGINIEQMGRAGLELAIQDAQNRMAFRENELARGAGVYDIINQNDQQRFSDAQNMYQFQQNAGLKAMDRQAAQAQAAAEYQAAPYTARLGDYYGMKSALYALPGQVLGAAGTAMSGGYKPLSTPISSGASYTPVDYKPYTKLASEGGRLEDLSDPSRFKYSRQLT